MTEQDILQLRGLAEAGQVQFKERIVSKEDRYDNGCEMVEFSNSRDGDLFLVPYSPIHPRVDGNGRTTRLVMNMIQRQLGLVPSIVRKDDKGEYIQSLVDSHENEDSSIAQDTMLRHHIANLNRRVLEYKESIMKDY